MHTPLEVIQLSKVYNDKEAVKNISFKINKNEIIGILGPNGCGKTTTIGMILGLLKPTKGKVLINGLEIETKRVDLLNNLNFISPYIELPKKLTVKQNLEVYGRLYDVEKLNSKIDYLVENKTLKIPNYIKIDVDGIENLILKGAMNTLKRKELIEISIELNPTKKDQYENIVKNLKENNFSLVKSENYNLIKNPNYKLKINETVNSIFRKN